VTAVSCPDLRLAPRIYGCRVCYCCHILSNFIGFTYSYCLRVISPCFALSLDHVRCVSFHLWRDLRPISWWICYCFSGWTVCLSQPWSPAEWPRYATHALSWSTYAPVQLGLLCLVTSSLVNTLMIRRRGCRAGRKVKLKLQRRAVGVRYNNPDHMIDVADVGQQRQIPTLITNRTAVVVNNNRSLARVHSSSSKRRRCVQRVARHNHSMQHHFTTKPPPTLYVFNSASLAKPHAICEAVLWEMYLGLLLN